MHPQNRSFWPHNIPTSDRIIDPICYESTALNTENTDLPYNSAYIVEVLRHDIWTIVKTTTETRPVPSVPLTLRPTHDLYLKTDPPPSLLFSYLLGSAQLYQ